MRSPDVTTLVAGLATLALGAVLLADSLGAFELSFAAFAPLVLAAVGATLLASGLGRRD
jgi:membrane protein implicated in regulation of membrane protease activity